jgi:hypothetical protein
VSFSDRSFSGSGSPKGSAFRPSPEVKFEEDGSFGAIVTPWGSRACAKRVIDTLSDFILSAKNDIESTSPFQLMTCLSPTGNNLRTAVMLANDVLYREENKSDYQAGVELFAFSRTSNEFSFAQIGHPQVLLHRKSTPLRLLGSQLDLAFEWSTAKRLFAPLPHNLLGLHSTSNFQVVSFRPIPGDELIFLSRTYCPATLLQQTGSEINLDDLSRLLAKDNSEQPFWLGRYQLPIWKSLGAEDAA